MLSDLMEFVIRFHWPQFRTRVSQGHALLPAYFHMCSPVLCTKDNCQPYGRFLVNVLRH